MPANGIILIDKPLERTSRWTTNRVSRIFGEKKAGHLGTLDPMATGVLPIALGKATRLIRFLEKDDKQYQGTIVLGQTTDTQDAAGEVIREGDWSKVTEADVLEALRSFVGPISQVPPMHSAIKKDGQPLYKLARKGIEIEREPRRVTIFEIEAEKIELPELVIRVRCEPGTYMRTLANDLGDKLGCGAHLKALVRLASGPFRIEHAVALDALDQDNALEHLIPLADCLPGFPAVELTKTQYGLVKDGGAVVMDVKDAGAESSGHFRLLYGSKLIAVAKGIVSGDQVTLNPVRVLV